MKRIALILGSLLLLAALSGCAGGYYSYQYPDDYYYYPHAPHAPLGFHGPGGDSDANFYGH